MTNLRSYASKYGIYSYKSDLIRLNADNHQNWKHRKLTIQDDFLANTYICQLDQEIFMYKPIVVPDIFTLDSEASETDLEQESEPEQSDISREWDLEKWDDFLIEILNIGRTHSYCAVQLYNKAPFWRVFYEREIDYILYDKNDNPVGCKVSWSKKLEKAQKPWRNHEENLVFHTHDRISNDGNSALFIPFGVPTGDDLGYYDLQSLWDLLIYIRWVVFDISNNSAKTSGFYHYLFGEGISQDQQDRIVELGSSVSSRSGLGAKKSDLEKIEAIYPKNPEFSVTALDKYLKLFAGASRLPLQFYNGEREIGGGLSGTAGVIDEDLVIKKKKYIFGQFENYIKTLIEMRWGIPIESIQPYIPAEIAFEENKSRMDEQMNQTDETDDKEKEDDENEPEIA